MSTIYYVKEFCYKNSVFFFTLIVVCFDLYRFVKEKDRKKSFDHSQRSDVIAQISLCILLLLLFLSKFLTLQVPVCFIAF